MIWICKDKVSDMSEVNTVFLLGLISLYVIRSYIKNNISHYQYRSTTLSDTPHSSGFLFSPGN